MKHPLPAFALIIPTADRATSLHRTLLSVAEQDVLPRRIVIADHSTTDETQRVVESFRGRLATAVEFRRCRRAGAAVQRNQGAAGATEPILLFMDDDIRLEPGCFEAMLQPFADDADSRLGGVGAVNLTCHYGNPSRLSRWVFDRLAEHKSPSYAGRLIGPALNLMPAVGEPGMRSPADWLAAGCVAYRREAFEVTGFGTHFARYSLGEDVELSARVARRWSLRVAHGARYIHNPPPTKAAGVAAIGRMDVVNRYRLMTDVLGRRGGRYLFRFVLLQLFQLLSAIAGVRPNNVRRTVALWLGRLLGYAQLLWGIAAPRRRTVRVHSFPRVPNRQQPHGSPLVSLVIVTRDRREGLADMLQRCRQQTYRPLEILVLDDASTDGTAAMVRRRFPNVRLLRRERSSGLVSARNEALRAARGQWLVSLDDDAWLLDPDGLHALVEAGDAVPEAGVVTFDVFDHRRPAPGGEPDRSAEWVHTFSGGASAVRREAWEQVGPYRDFYRYGAEEDDLAIRLMDAGWRIARAHGIRAFHDKQANQRDVPWTFRHGACNNLCNVVLNEPLGWAALHLPVMLVKQAAFAWRRRCFGALAGAVAMWLGRLPSLLRARRPVRSTTCRRRLELSQCPEAIACSWPAGRRPAKSA